MSARDTETDEASGHFKPGDVIWFDYPHPDTARRCPKGPECYEQLHHRTLPSDDTFVVVMEAKRRTVLVLDYVAPSSYKIMKLTTKNKGQAGGRLLVYEYAGGRKSCYACLDEVHTYPTHLAGEKDRVLDIFRMKQISTAWRGRNQCGPQPQGAPGRGDMS